MFQPMLAPLIWVIGSYGITFLILLMNSIIFSYIIKKDKKLILIAFMLAIILLSSFTYSYLSQPEGEKIKIAMIQGNIQENWNWRINNAGEDVFEKYKKMTLEAAKENPDIIIWPEYAIPADLKRNEELLSNLSSFAKKINATLVLGTLQWHDEYYNKDKRFKENIASVFSQDGEYIGEYSSIKPLMYEKWTLPGGKLEMFNIKNKKFGITMCYEETQRFISKEYSKKGADFIISLANNQRLKNSKGIYLSSLYSRINAAENRKYVLRSTNTGITQVINPYGKIVAKLERNKEDVLITEIFIK